VAHVAVLGLLHRVVVAVDNRVDVADDDLVTSRRPSK
jgi:hypothetical protein